MEYRAQKYLEQLKLKEVTEQEKEDPNYVDLPISTDIPFKYLIKIMIIIFATIAFIIGFDHLLICLLHKSLLCVIVKDVILSLF